jgi:hypothetical protein
MAEAKTSKETMTMKTQLKIALASALVLLLGAFAAPSASASFGFEEGSVNAWVRDATENPFQAAAHPDEVVTEFKLKTEPDLRPGKAGRSLPEEAELRNVTVESPPGLIGNPTVTPRCELSEFLGAGLNAVARTACPDSTQVGVVNTPVDLFHPGQVFESALYDLRPQPGQPALFGFYVATVPVLAVPSIRESDYGIDFNVLNIDQSAPVLGNEFTFWGDPASPAHDEERGNREADAGWGKCSDGRTLGFFDKLLDQFAKENHEPLPFPLLCSSGAPERAFLTSPTDCEHGPYTVPTEVESWIGTTDRESVVSHDEEGNPSGVVHCERVPFKPTISAEPTTKNSSSPSGLAFGMKIPDTGLLNPEGRAQANLKKAVVTLPEGFTLNPSAGEGLTGCSEAQYEAEKVGTEPGQGCPNSSKLGNVTIDSPLLEQGELVEGSLYVAEPNDPSKAGQENPFDSLVAMYLVARVPQRGVIVKSAGKVDLDPQTGQITTTFDDLPQLPFSDFQLRFREGGRAPLVTPQSCGEKSTKALLYPYSAPTVPTEVSSVSLITNGADGGNCPSGGLPPFKPGLIAGSINNAAGRFSPFDVRLTRTDSEQEITHFSIKLPPGLVGKLAGVPLCSDAAIVQAKGREHIGGGREEQLAPSCPAASQIGRTLVGAGVGSILTYVPGKVYLAGPYHGAPVSIVAITSGVVGPFDIGTVAVRQALRVDPETGEVFIDATGSDPIPHIVDGVATHIRDLRVYVDRPEFTLNPTSCTRTSTSSTVLGSGLDFASDADDNPFVSTSPFQAADCAALPFGPKLSFRLKGGTQRGQNPSLLAHVAMNGIGEAAISYAQVALPRSEFLDNSHIGTVCTRVQFRAGDVPGEKCPAASVYGHVSATTPILEGPLEGPIFLRSSEHKLPDLVAALHHREIDVSLVGRVDSVKGGGIRNTFEFVPDAPVTSADFVFDGAAKGLLENSTNICKGKHLATVKLKGHNGKVSNYKAPLKAKCGKKGSTRKRHQRRAAR